MAYQKNAKIEELLNLVYEAESGRGYPAIKMMADYLSSGDPSYITTAGSARSRIMNQDSAEIIAELLKVYFGKER
ncbi:MAG: IreB family regulatory phosphoprotein [Lachnospiraceae bacterium]|nr:IreB family regulatory phosphoprotein [Lachnospiraceae bacterium]MBQ9562467.1 IreB family regulatory phosphoprotein [Lachnospiraceae bacterium]MBR0154219.1 IreB family regulatory phosphoprotein [Lachnospiraceae bacterium]